MQKSCIQIYSIIILLLFGTLPVLTQQKPFLEWVSSYEQEMVHGVGLWKKGEYGSALDRLRAARDIVTANIPKPTEYYKWYAGLSMKTYALVLIRMIEMEVEEQEGKSEAVLNRTTQIYEWGEKLKEQAKAWILVEDVSPPDSLLRETWIRRYLAVLKRVEPLSKTGDRNIHENNGS